MFKKVIPEVIESVSPNVIETVILKAGFFLIVFKGDSTGVRKVSPKGDFKKSDSKSRCSKSVSKVFQKVFKKVISCGCFN